MWLVGENGKNSRRRSLIQSETADNRQEGLDPTANHRGYDIQAMGALRLLPPQFEDAPSRWPLLGPGQGLRGRVDLIIVATVRKHCEFVHVIREPRSRRR